MAKSKTEKLQRHSTYMSRVDEWEKNRYCYDGGREFVNKYLKKFTRKENDDDFDYRKELTYAPGCAAAALEEIKTAIYQRIYDVQRSGGSKSYQDAINGIGAGVDGQGATMGSFIGDEFLLELLLQGKVGALVDAPEYRGITKADDPGTPYVVMVCAESILNWAPYNPKNGFDSVLIRLNAPKYDTNSWVPFPNSMEEKYILYERTPDGVRTREFDHQEQYIEGSDQLLELSRIPFHVFELPVSLMRRVVDKEIALMNIESSDLMFCLTSNFPMFYEQYDSADPSEMHSIEGGDDNVNDTTANAKLGLAKGRRYSTQITMEPGFINPDPGVLQVSMEKGTSLKEDIRLSVNLNLVSMNPRRSSAESKKQDLSTLEASLSYIGLILETGESEIAKFWEAFENGNVEPATIKYPLTYGLKTDAQLMEEADALLKFQDRIANTDVRRTIVREVVKKLLRRHVTTDELDKLVRSIEQQKVFPPSAEYILQAVEQFAIDNESAAEALGFDAASAKRAIEQRKEHAAYVAQSQSSAARGDKGSDVGDATSADEKRGKAGRGNSVPNNE